MHHDSGRNIIVENNGKIWKQPKGWARLRVRYEAVSGPSKRTDREDASNSKDATACSSGDFQNPLRASITVSDSGHCDRVLGNLRARGTAEDTIDSRGGARKSSVDDANPALCVNIPTMHGFEGIHGGIFAYLLWIFCWRAWRAEILL